MTPEPAEFERGADAAGRWFIARAALLAVVVITACVLLGVLAARTARVWDLTGTRGHRLAAQTVALLERVNEPVELVVAAPLAEADATGVARLREVVGLLAAQQPRLRASVIDTASAAGAAEFAAVLGRLRERSAEQIARTEQATRRALDEGRVLAEELVRAGAALEAVAAAMEDAPAQDAQRLRSYWSGQATAARKLAEETTARVAAGERTLGARLEPLGVPPLDDAVSAAAQPLAGVSASLAVLGKALDDFARLPEASAPALAKDRAGALAAGVATLRDRAARAQNELAGLPKVAAIQVARAVQSDRAALLIGDSGSRPAGDTRPALLAMDVEQMMPPARGSAAGSGGARPVGVDLRFRTEELVAGALAGLTSTERPLVVLVHGSGRRLGPDFAAFRKLADRLDVANMELAEWAAGLDEPPPVPLKRTDPRPVVWATIGLETGSAESAVRMGKLSAAIGQLVETRQALLVSMNPSNLPNVGAADPMAECLAPLGVLAETGRVVLEQSVSAAGDGGGGGGGGKPVRSVYTDQYVREPGSDHPVAATIAGVQTRLPWAVPVSQRGGSAGNPGGVRVHPLLVLAPAPDRWTDEEWTTLRQTPPAERAGLTNLPMPTGPRARPLPAEGLTVAVAAERAGGAGEGGEPSRAIVVGSNGWFFDGVVRPSSVIDGRVVFDAPGNLQLFESCVWWLTGREDRLGMGASAASGAIIPELSSGQLGALRWVLIGGLPLGVLLLGVLWRAVRG